MKPVKRDSVRDQVRRAITERILEGRYQPGDRLVELQLARELGVSQGSVREALRELEASRLVECEPNRGTRVRVVSPRELRNAYIARGALEQAAAATAVTHFKGNAECLRRECEEIIRCAQAGDLAGQAEHNYAFHRSIVAASGNCVLLRLWESLAFETRTRMRLALKQIDLVSDAESHRAIVAALESGNGKKAGRLLREHAEGFAPTPEEIEQAESAAVVTTSGA